MKTPYYNVPNLQKIADLEAEIGRLREAHRAPGNLQAPHEIEIDQIHNQQLAAKDAQIALLKADVEYWHHIATVEKNQLITELCDALKKWEAAKHWDWTVKLLERAREATPK